MSSTVLSRYKKTMPTVLCHSRHILKEVKTLNKIFTFQIEFNNGKKPDEIEFCAYTKEEAVCLFNDWCREDENMPRPFPIKSIKVVYNKDDAEEYGTNYGKPETYSINS